MKILLKQWRIETHEEDRVTKRWLSIHHVDILWEEKKENEEALWISVILVKNQIHRYWKLWWSDTSEKDRVMKRGLSVPRVAISPSRRDFPRRQSIERLRTWNFTDPYEESDRSFWYTMLSVVIRGKKKKRITSIVRYPDNIDCQTASHSNSEIF